MNTTSSRASSAGRRSTGTTISLGLPLLSVLAGVYVGAVLFGGVVRGQLALPLLVAAFAGYRLGVPRISSERTRAVVRDAGALALGAVLAAGAWVMSVIGGVLAEVVPFIGDGHYPYANAWMVGWGVLAALSVPLWWTLLRRWADPELRRS